MTTDTPLNEDEPTKAEQPVASTPGGTPTPVRRRFNWLTWLISGIALVLIVVLVGGGIAAIAGHGRWRHHGFDGRGYHRESYSYMNDGSAIPEGAIAITDQQARDTALAANSGATVQAVNILVEKDGTVVYGVVLDKGNEVFVNAKTGEIISTGLAYRGDFHHGH